MEDSSKEVTEEKASLILEGTRFLEDSDCDPPEDFLSERDKELPVCHLKKEREAGETCPTDTPFETNPAVPRVEAYRSTSVAASEDLTPACNNTNSTNSQERCETTVKEEPEIESHLSMNQAHFLVKEESVDSNESWVDRIKQEPTLPLSVNTPKEESDEIDDQDTYVKLSMNQAHFLVKEESVDSNESCLDGIKQEQTSPLSVDTPKEESDEIDNQDMDVKDHATILTCCRAFCSVISSKKSSKYLW